MINHASYLGMLACPAGLSRDEQEQLRQHLLSCTACQEIAMTYRRQDVLLRAVMVGEPPPRLATAILAHLLPTQTRRMPSFRLPSIRPLWRWVSMGLIAAILALGVGTGTFLPRGSATPASAYTLLQQATQAATFPSSGAAVVRYTFLDWQALPDAAVSHLGSHIAQVRWLARDSTHFRITVRTVRPALNSGWITVVMDGKTITTYDSRTNTASVTADMRMNLLELLQSGASFTSMPPPADSIAGFLRGLHQRTRPGVTRVRSHVRLLGQTTMLGRTVDVVMFAPVYLGCFGGGANGCLHVRGFAVGQVWVDHQTHVILQYRVSQINDVHTLPIDYLYRVTSFQPGQGPSNSDMHYRPPVPVKPVRTLFILPSNIYGYGGVGARSVQGEVPAGFLRVPPPLRLAGAAPVYVGTQFRPVGPTAQPTTVDVLYSTGQFVTTHLWPGRVHNRFVNGPYLDVEERIQTRGLPRALHAGTPVVIGRCQARTGTYLDGQNWLAFAHGRISVLMTTNALSIRELTQYATQRVCP